MWVKTFACRLKTKLIMWENLTRKLSLDFQENISEVRKLPLSFHFAAENWSKMAILVELWQKLALYWLYWQLFSGKAKRKKKKSEWVGTAIKKKYKPEIFWRTTAMKATVLAQGMTLLWGGLNLLKIVSFKSAENKFLFCLSSHKTKSMHIYNVYCWPANLKVVSLNNEVINL